MRSNFQKFFGWALLLAGVGIILWSLYSSYNIFNNKVPVPEIFKIEEKKPVSPKKTQGLEAQLEEKLKKMMAEQFKDIIPSDNLVKLFNLIAWSIFSGILIFGGGQIASLGIKLLK